MDQPTDGRDAAAGGETTIERMSKLRQSREEDGQWIEAEEFPKKIRNIEDSSKDDAYSCAQRDPPVSRPLLHLLLLSADGTMEEGLDPPERRELGPAG